MIIGDQKRIERAVGNMVDLVDHVSYWLPAPIRDIPLARKPAEVAASSGDEIDFIAPAREALELESRAALEQTLGGAKHTLEIIFGREKLNSIRRRWHNQAEPGWIDLLRAKPIEITVKQHEQLLEFVKTIRDQLDFVTSELVDNVTRGMDAAKSLEGQKATHATIGVGMFAGESAMGLALFEANFLRKISDLENVGALVVRQEQKSAGKAH